MVERAVCPDEVNVLRFSVFQHEEQLQRHRVPVRSVGSVSQTNGIAAAFLLLCL